MILYEILGLLLFATVCVVLMAGFPVAFTLGGVSLLFALAGGVAGVFDLSFLGFVSNRIFGVMTNEVLIAVPLFVFMGVMLERSKVAEELLDAMGAAFGRLPGGLGIAVCVVGALLAASTGIVGATVVTMGLLSLPTMLNRGYDPKLATGAICASGTLGQIIPPSIVLVVLGDQISNAYQDAQRQLGNFAPDPVSVGDLFAGALIPGLLLVGLYVLFIVVRALITPGDAPPVPREALAGADGEAIFGRALRALVAPIVLIVAVLGSILAGVATPTEAAAVGAVGAAFLGGLRISDAPGRPIYVAAAALVFLLVLTAFVDLRFGREDISGLEQAGIAAAAVACLGLGWGLFAALRRIAADGTLRDVAQSTTRISAMVFGIVIGAQLFSLVFRGFHGDDIVHEFLKSLPGGAAGAMFAVMALMFVMGFFLDFIEITFVVVPIVAPILLLMDLNPIWLGIMIAVNLQTSFLTPPFGFALFYLRGVAPPSVLTADIYKGIIPFVLLQLAMLGILALAPELTLWLPRLIYGTVAGD
ncbi:MAG: TRAP transporter large permease subunit [Alphaproteobacteria bacterium]